MLFKSDTFGPLALLSEDGCHVPVPAVLLLALSPLVRSLMADLLPPAHNHHVLSIPEDMKRKVVKVFHMMMIESFISCHPLDNICSDHVVEMNVEEAN